MASEYNYEWSKIANLPEFKGKTDNALRRKFRTMLMKEKDEEITNFVKKPSLTKSILKFKHKQKREKTDEEKKVEKKV